jgi:formate hydrogenlyase subunit 4
MFLEVLRGVAHLLAGLALAPLLLSVINRTKAKFAGRVGQPWLQPYYDLWKLLQKGAVYSETTTWVFRAGPLVALAAVLAALFLLPFGGARAVASFDGDLLVFVYLLGLARVAMILAALDTGSSFEGMGASREAWVSALAEPALLLALAALSREAVSRATAGGAQAAGLAHASLSALHGANELDAWHGAAFILVLAGVSLFVVLLAETARVPVDDPTTHLELTMIHEVQVLDHGGPDFAFILYAQALKLWALAALLVGLVLPTRTGLALLDEGIALAGVFAVAVGVGVIESVMARLRLNRVPRLLIGAASLAALAFVLER